MRGLVMVLLALPLVAQVRVLATPEPMAVVRSLGLREIGLWTVVCCQDGPVPVVVSRERLMLALPSVRMIGNDRARAVLASSVSRTPKATAARILRYAILGAAIGAGFAGVPAKAVAGLALGAAGAEQFARQMESEIPSLGPWTVGLTEEPLRLEPGVCGSRVVFAALQRNARPVETVIR